jgi:hypothetical protein
MIMRALADPLYGDVLSAVRKLRKGLNQFIPQLGQPLAGFRH